MSRLNSCEGRRKKLGRGRIEPAGFIEASCSKCFWGWYQADLSQRIFNDTGFLSLGLVTAIRPPLNRNYSTPMAALAHTTEQNTSVRSQADLFSKTTPDAAFLATQRAAVLGLAVIHFVYHITSVVCHGNWKELGMVERKGRSKRRGLGCCLLCGKKEAGLDGLIRKETSSNSLDILFQSYPALQMAA